MDQNEEASNIAVVYLDGYAYTGTEWYSYSLNEDPKIVRERKGKKIGEIALDLKDLIYEGVPPNFSSTFNVSAEVYEVKGLKRENAVLIVSGEYGHILYRSEKATASENEPIGLTVGDVFGMISDYAEIRSVELRSEMDGSLMRTSYDDSFLELLNTEIRDKEILNNEEIKQQKGVAGEPGMTQRVPVNLVFKDGAMLHMQVYSEENIACVFHGYIDISEELSLKFTELHQLGDEYLRITGIVGLDPDDLGYFKFKNHVTGYEITSLEPKWSGGALHDWLKRYSVDRALSEAEGALVFTVKFGESEENHRVLEIYEGADKNLFFRADGAVYTIVKGNLAYEDLLIYQENYTSY